MLVGELETKDFNKICEFFFQRSGIRLSDKKRNLVKGRLSARLKARELDSFSKYVEILEKGEDKIECQMAVDLLTTNETYFYRESKHFVLLNEMMQTWTGKSPPKIWCAACSTGEEPYTLAMLMSENFQSRPWSITASDISTKVLEVAKSGLYPDSRISKLPLNLKSSYLLKGKQKYQGMSLVDKSLRSRINFEQRNLMEPQKLSEKVDIIFLRNMLIYFDTEQKRKIINNVTANLEPEGTLFVGHSESLHEVVDNFKATKPGVYKRKVE